MKDFKWTESNITRTLAQQVFNRNLVLVPNCSWPGSECDLLVITENLRIIDVEVKISRSDLKREASKDKWYHNWNYNLDTATREKRDWPRKVWKHYLAMPEAIYEPSLLTCLPSEKSGIILLIPKNNRFDYRVVRKATPDKSADKITPEMAIDIARLASIRMWKTYEKLEKIK